MLLEGFGEHVRKQTALSVLAAIVVTVACGQVTPVAVPTDTKSASPTPQSQADARSTIFIGTEYITIENAGRVSFLAQTLAPVGFTSAKPLPENFAWGRMQPSPDAEIDFRQLDHFVGEFQTAGFTELILALKPNSSWASNTYLGEVLLPLQAGVKPEYLDNYENWVYSVVERYDADGSEDMPGLLYPIRFYEIGTEFTSYEPEPVEEYLAILERAYAAAHRADDHVLVAHTAFLTTLAFADNPAPADYESAFEGAADQTHSLADMRQVLDRPDLFDMINIHSLGDPYEIEAIVTWLNFEMAQRGYQKRIIISDTATTPYISWGPATTCDKPISQMGKLIPPATEADRCRLADYFTKLVNGDEPTLRWTQAIAAQDMVKKVVISAEQGILFIDTAFAEDLYWLKLPIAQAAAGASAWAGQVDVERREYRPGYYALQQLIHHLDGYNNVTRIVDEDDGIRIYAIDHPDRRLWIAWYDPDNLILPEDPLPQIATQLDAGLPTVVVETLITQFSQTLPVQVILPTQGGIASLTLTPTPIFIYAGE